MYTDEQIQILQKFHQNKDQLSQDEMKKLYLWFNSEKGDREFESLLNEKWLQVVSIPDDSLDSERLFREIKQQIRQNEQHSPLRKILRWAPYAAAVLIIGILVIGSQFYTLMPRLSNQVGLLYEYKSPTNRPEKIVLPDGSRVVLFPGSYLVVPNDFTEAPIRNVKLEGEAFFQVSHNEKQPFVLNLGGVGVKVVGTTFNVSNYPDDNYIEVALETGKVKLYQGDWEKHNEEVPLDPGYMARYVRGEDGFTIIKTDVKRYMSWMNGMLVFRDNPMKDVFRKLERWYGVDIEVQDPAINSYVYTATIKNESLEKILKLLEYTSPIKCKLEKNSSGQVSKVYIQNK